MKLQKQPTAWSCLPTAFAMALDKPVEEIIKAIGHDGSEVYWPELESHWANRAFHVQELVDYCFWNEIAVVCIDAMPCFNHFDSRAVAKEVKYLSGLEYADRLERYLKSYFGVLVGTTNFNSGHAVAWDGENVFNPRGAIESLENANFNIMSFYILGKCRSKSFLYFPKLNEIFA